AAQLRREVTSQGQIGFGLARIEILPFAALEPRPLIETVALIRLTIVLTVAAITVAMGWRWIPTTARKIFIETRRINGAYGFVSRKRPAGKAKVPVGGLIIESELPADFFAAAFSRALRQRRGQPHDGVSTGI